MQTQTRTAALGALIILQVIMLASLLFKIPPHPPEVIPIGGMAPVIAASLCAAVAAVVFNGDGWGGKALILCACLFAAISYGPQKFLDPAFPLVWPAVVTAQIAIIALIAPMGRDILQR